jgi:hypothetical protein
MRASTRDGDLDILRRLTPEQKLAAMTALIRQAFELKVAALRAAEPGLDEAAVWAKARDLVAGGSS